MEITETAIMADPGRAQAGLEMLREAGINLSMDDFGVGQSSLTYLKDLPSTKMKIDKSFVMDIGEPRNAAIVQSAIDLARHMGLGITAEGVETDAAYQALRNLGCEQGQGMFFSWGLPADALMAWLRDSRWGAGAIPS
jgi:EAL domain-containing protein (putative c-di-GMP-specific phosphodiesterase class I)